MNFTKVNLVSKLRCIMNVTIKYNLQNNVLLDA